MGEKARYKRGAGVGGVPRRFALGGARPKNLAPPGSKSRRGRLARLDLVKTPGGWALRGQTGARAYLVSQRKEIALGELAYLARIFDLIGVTVRIHKANGKIAEERTYPRSHDPKRSKG